MLVASRPGQFIQRVVCSIISLSMRTGISDASGYRPEKFILYMERSGWKTGKQTLQLLCISRLQGIYAPQMGSCSGMRARPD